MTETISVMLVDDISSTLDNLQKLLAFEEDIVVAGTAANGLEAVEEAKRLNPAIILMDVNMPEMDGIQATEVVAREAPASPVIIMSVQGERDYLRRAMQAGAREFLIKPFSGDELIQSIRRVYQLEQRKETYRAVSTAPPVETPVAEAGPAVETAPASEADQAIDATAGVTEAAAAIEAPSAEVPLAEAEAGGPGDEEPPGEALPRLPTNGEVIVLYAGKGGVGKSVIAANLACAIAKETGARVALVDLHLQFGDIGVLLNLPQSQTITDLVESIDSLDPQFILDIMSEGPAGVRVLTTPSSPEMADLVTPDHIQVILTALRSMFDFIVVDTSNHLGDITLTALDMSTRLLMVTALSIPAVKNSKLALRLFDTLSIPSERITLILNRSEAHTEFNKDSIEAHLKFPIAIQLPHDPRTVVNSINRGMPFVISNPEAEVSQKVRQLVGLLQPAGDASAERAPSRGKAKRGFGRK